MQPDKNRKPSPPKKEDKSSQYSPKKNAHASLGAPRITSSTQSAVERFQERYKEHNSSPIYDSAKIPLEPVEKFPLQQEISISRLPRPFKRTLNPRFCCYFLT